MKPNQTVSLLATLGPAAVAAPPLLIGAAIGLGLIWLLSEKEKPTTPQAAPEKTAPATSARIESAAPKLFTRQPQAASRRVTREDVAEALGYGSRPLPRLEAVAALQALGFGKTAAYKGLSSDGRFGELLEHTPDGLIEWKG